MKMDFVADYASQDRILGYSSLPRFHVLFLAGTEGYTAVQAVRLALKPLEQRGMARFDFGDQFPISST